MKEFLTLIPTLLKARKSTFSKLYHCAWKVFFTWWYSFLTCHRTHFDLSFSLVWRGQWILSIIKGHILTLAILFQRPIASCGLVKAFCAGSVLLVRSPWDLNLVLSILQSSPFEPLRDPLIAPFLFSATSAHSVSALALLSCKEPFMILHQCKVVLRTRSGHCYHLFILILKKRFFTLWIIKFELIFSLYIFFFNSSIPCLP